MSPNPHGSIALVPVLLLLLEVQGSQPVPRFFLSSAITDYPGQKHISSGRLLIKRLGKREPTLEDARQGAYFLGPSSSSSHIS
ncbi:hypothetical protein CRM22_002804, partial [Opisthorchis felineus]